MHINENRQSILTQLPLTFSGLKKMTISTEYGTTMNLQQRIRFVMDELMPAPDRGKQVRLAKIADESKQVVNHWLSGVTKEIQYETARRICEHFGLRMDWLMRGKGPIRQDDDETTPSVETMALVYVTAKEQEIVTAFRATDEIGKKIIEAAAAQMKRL